MITLSICLIVKNEEKNIRNCLDSVKDFADEIIVVDTGSTDNTIDICKGYTDKVYKIWWQDDFSKARNYSFKKAKSDYIMWLDADDIITAENIEKIKALKTTLPKGVDIVLMKYITSVFSSGEPRFYFYRERIIRNSPKFRWQGFVHEYISVLGNIVYENISIFHNKAEGQKYSTRNLKIYEKAKKKNKRFTSRDYYYYARELYYHKKYSKAISNFTKFLELEKENQSDIYEAKLLVGECYFLQNKFDKALEKYFQILQVFLPSSKLYCKIADVFMVQKRLDLAICYYQQALENHNPITQTFVEIEYQNIIPCLQLCVAYYKKGNIKKAEQYNAFAEKFDSQNRAVVYNKQLFKNYK